MKAHIIFCKLGPTLEIGMRER